MSVCVSVSVCLFVTFVRPAITAEPIDMPFGMMMMMTPMMIRDCNPASIFSSRDSGLRTV